MGELKSFTNLENDTHVITLMGAIDEDAQLDDMAIPNGNHLVIDFSSVDAINSCGIREWIKWVQKVPSTCQIEFRNCPKIIVDQINMVAGFLPAGAFVSSFYVPYYCEVTGSEKMLLFQHGTHFKGKDVFPPDDIVDDETGDEMEMDVIESKYFKFLTKMAN